MRWLRVAPLVVFLLNKQLQITIETRRPSNSVTQFWISRHVAQSVYGLFYCFSVIYEWKEKPFSFIHGDVHIFSIVTTEPKGQTGPHLEQSTEDLVTLLTNRH